MVRKLGRIGLAVVAVASALVVPAGGTATASPDRPRQAIVQLHADIDAAWNREDAKAFAALWTPDGTVVSPLGQLSVGRGNIQRDEAAGFAGPMKGTRHKLTVQQIYAVTGTTAVVDGEAEISGMRGLDGTAYPPLTARFTSIVVRVHGRWLVAHMRSYVYVTP
jgi:uncharacterized protein (TIGR02246 family)